MHNPPRLGLSVVIPVYGSEKVLPELTARLKAVLDRIGQLRSYLRVRLFSRQELGDDSSVVGPILLGSWDFAAHECGAA